MGGYERGIRRILFFLAMWIDSFVVDSEREGSEGGGALEVVGELRGICQAVHSIAVFWRYLARGRKKKEGGLGGAWCVH